MSQRWLLSGMGVRIAICLCLTGMMFWQLQQQRAEMIVRQQKLTDIVERLTQLSDAKAKEVPQPPPAPMPSSIKVKLTLDKPDGPPAVGCYVSLRRVGVDKENGPEVRSDEQGIVDFGYFEPAKYAISIRTDRTSDWQLNRTFSLPLSTAHVEPVICSRESTQPIRWTVSIPEDLESHGVQVLVTWNRTLNCGGQEWKDASSDPRLSVIRFGLRSGEPLRANLFNAKSEWERGAVSNGAIQFLSRRTTDPKPKEAPFKVLFYRSAMSQPVTTDSVGVRFQGVRLLLVMPAPPADNRGISQRDDFQRSLIAIAPPLAEVSNEDQQPTQPGTPKVIVRKLQWADLKDEYVVAADKPNQWTIQVPDELIEQARAYLKEHPETTSEQESK